MESKSSEGRAALASQILNRSHRFEGLYSGFLEHHVLFLLRLSKVQLHRLISTPRFKAIKSFVDGESEEFLSYVSSNLTGLNRPLIEFISSIMKLVRKLHLEKPKKGAETFSTSEFKEPLQTLVSILKRSKTSFDDHTLIVLSWWLPQLLEIIAMLVSKNSHFAPSIKKEVQLAVESCIDMFEENSHIAAYLLSGDYLYRNEWSNFLSALTSDTIKSGDYHLRLQMQELEQRGKAKVEIIRGLESSAVNVFDVDLPASFPSKAIFNLHDDIRLKILVEPPFGVLSALSHLTMVKQEEDEVGRSILRFFGSNNRLLLFLKTAISREVASTSASEVLFRGESVATKMLSSLFFSPFGGLNFLKTAIQPLINDISQEEEETINGIKVTSHAEAFLKRIFRSSKQFPGIVRIVLNHVQREVSKKFPEMRLKVIGGFFFLRFVCPTLVTPEKFGFQRVSTNERRFLIAVSKLLQNLANGIKFDETTSFADKFNAMIDANIEGVQNFFDSLADISHIRLDSSSDVFSELSEAGLQRDFQVIKHQLTRFHREVKDIMKVHYPQSLTLYHCYLNLENPSIIRELALTDDPYSAQIRSLTDFLPPNILKHLLGTDRAFSDSKIGHSWFKDLEKRYLRINRILKSVSFYREEIREWLEKLMHLHDALEAIFQAWPNSFALLSSDEEKSDIRKQTLRQIMIVAYELDAILGTDAGFFSPDSLQMWLSLNDMIDRTVQILLMDYHQEFSNSPVAKDALSLLITHMRWSVSRLLEIQNTGVCIEL